MNVILDLDETIITSLDENELKRIDTSLIDAQLTHVDMPQYTYCDRGERFRFYARPGLPEFLKYLFANFNVSVWTAASKSYAIFVVDTFLRGYDLDYVLFSHHCRESNKFGGESHKDLRLLKDIYDIVDYRMDNTIIIDDNLDVCKNQPYNCVHVKPFRVDGDEAVQREAIADDELNAVKIKLMTTKHVLATTHNLRVKNDRPKEKVRYVEPREN